MTFVLPHAQLQLLSTCFANTRNPSPNMRPNLHAIVIPIPAIIPMGTCLKRQLLANSTVRSPNHPPFRKRLISTSIPLLPRYGFTKPCNVPLAPSHRRGIAVTATAPDAMFRQPPPEPGADFNVVMIGAGVSLTFDFLLFPTDSDIFL